MEDRIDNVRVAAVQANPVFLDKNASVEKACALIKEAAAGGAKVIVFPEGFIPSHPVWYHLHPATDKTAMKLSIGLFNNSLVVPGPETAKLGKAAKDAGAYVVIGVCEKRPNSTGTMFNSTLFFGPDGELLFKHQKTMPTVGERLVHALGGPETNGVVQTEFGPLSGLLCSENSNPLLVFSTLMNESVIHAASWPNFWPKGRKPMREFVRIATLNFAQMARCFVVSACSGIDEDTIRKLELTEQDEAILRDPNFCGGSLIVSPACDILAGQMGNEEGILYADCDINKCVAAKIGIDFSGHYNRTDLFTVIQRKTPYTFFKEVAEEQPDFSPDAQWDEEPAARS